MKKIVATLLGVSVIAFLAASCGGTTAEAPPDTPEFAAFQYRTSLMNTIAYKVAQVRGMEQGEIPVDEATAVKHARDIATLAGMIPEGFIPNSAVEGSAALPDVWTNMADFQQKAADLQSAAQALADAAAANGFEASKGMVQAVSGGCGGCHRPYRRRQE
ncbi:MAG TPA: cytochrome c [Gammaproteobacteria bacterium]|nr:cytochrome c [Gammaproteobacteria bacterium]